MPLARRAAGAAAVAVALAVPAAFGVFPLLVLAANALGMGIAPADEGPTLAHLSAALTSPSAQQALGNSILIAGGSVVAAAVLAVPLVLRQAHAERTGRRGLRLALMDGLLTLPIALPGIVIGFFAIVLVGRTGLFALAWEDVSGLAYTATGMLVAYVYFSLPRVVGPLRAVAREIDAALAETAATLGASPIRVLFTITLPLLLPALVEAAGTAAAVALGGYGTVATLSEGVRLLPLNVVNALSTGYRLAESSALAILLAATAVVAMLLGRLCATGLRRVMSR
ncbi:ABC transporter permease subunit [Microbacterium marinilacus]|uniref:ABC transporter permease n=1 Tax=Microbacterium marinilacus TaxID=415209 RepID=A0ABP7BM08_9MICO|nr:ABC transporter permease subunit [Microbacterium marinilacus]MBY0690359.1 ABC transporter permease subunit [Microbacterium marinilacus]